MNDYLFLDTNIVLDLLGRRQPFYESIAKLATLAEKGQLRLAVSALSFPTIHYILSKTAGKDASLVRLRKFRTLTDVISVDDALIEKGLNSNFADFEDALQYFCALQGGCTVLLTRNAKDFKHSALPVMTAEEYLASIGKK